MKIKNLYEKIALIICLLSFIKSNLVIIGPSDLVSRYYNKPIEIVVRKSEDMSNFYVHGEVFFENITASHSACTELDVLPSITSQNEYVENFKILLAYNGGCPIVHKARYAQEAGASMLLLINNNDEDIKNVIMDDDGSGSDIKIPVGLISLTNGRIMQNFIENNPKSRVMVEINFKEKEARKKVEFKFFFSSSELKAYQLINNLTKYTDKFNSQVDFTPIYVIHQSPQYDPQKATRQLNCVTKGKYCYFPKETTIIQDGQRILIESLRQKCMFKKAKDGKESFYEYLQNFYKNCLLYTPPKFNERCSKQTLDSLGYPVSYLDGCIAESFGVNSLLSSSYIDNENSIFKAEYDEILKYKLTSFPAVVINDKPLEGIIKENKVMEALCNAVNEKPDFCSIYTGKTYFHLSTIRKKKAWVYLCIIAIILINVVLFFICRKYIIHQISDKINYNAIDLDGRIHNFVTNYMSIKKTQEMDYQSFDTDNSSKNNKSNEQFTGTVDTL